MQLLIPPQHTAFLIYRVSSAFDSQVFSTTSFSHTVESDVEFEDWNSPLSKSQMICSI